MKLNVLNVALKSLPQVQAGITEVRSACRPPNEVSFHQLFSDRLRIFTSIFRLIDHYRLAFIDHVVSCKQY